MSTPPTPLLVEESFNQIFTFRILLQTAELIAIEDSFVFVQTDLKASKEFCLIHIFCVNTKDSGPNSRTRSYARKMETVS